jgi:WD40 repeat protein
MQCVLNFERAGRNAGRIMPKCAVLGYPPSSMAAQLRALVLLALVALASCGGPPRGVEPGGPGAAASSCPPFPPGVNGALDRPSILVQRGHASGVHRVALSDDGRTMVTMSADGTLLVWDTTSGLLLRRILTAGFAAQVTLSGKGDKVAYAGANPDAAGEFAILVVDLASGGPPRKVTQFGQIALSPDGKTMAVGINTVDLYDTTTLAKIRSLDLKPKGIYLAVAFDRLGKRLAMATVGEVSVIDVASWKETQRVTRSAALADTPIALDFAGDSAVLRSAAGAVELIPIGPGAAAPSVLGGRALDSSAGGGRAWVLASPAPPPGAPRGAPWVERLIAYGPGGAVSLDEEQPSDVAHVAVSGDGSTVALVRDDVNAGIRTITLRDGATLRPLRTFDVFTAGIAAVGVRPGGGELITGSTLGALGQWDLARGTLIRLSTAEEPSAPSSVSFDVKGEKLVAAGFGYTVRARDAASGRLLHQWKPHGDHFVAAASFLPGTSELLTVAAEGGVKRWDLSQGTPPPPKKPVFRYDELNPPAGREVGNIGHTLRRAAISPDGHALAFDDDSGALGVLDTTTGAKRWEVASPSFVGGGGTRRWIAFSGDGTRVLLSASEGPWGAKDSILRVFDAGSGALLQTLHTATVGPMAARAGIFALGGLRPLLLDPKSFATLAPIASFDSEVTAVAVHPSRDLLILGGSGGATAIASATSGKPMALFVASAGGDFVSSTPEGAFVASTDGARSLAWIFSGPLEAYAFEQFAARYEQPEAVRRRLAGEPPALDAPLLRPPRVDLQGEPPARTAARSVTLHAAVSSAGRVDQLRVFVNGRAALEKAVCAPKASVDLEIPLLPGQNRLTLVGYDEAGFAGTPRQVDIVSTEGSAPRPELWVVSVGVSRYPQLGAEHQLEYATADARSIAEAFAGQVGEGKPFARLHPITLLDDQVTVQSVEQAMAGLAAMGPDDLAVVFFAGHGVQLGDKGSDAKRMVFLTSGAALSSASARENGVGWDRIEGALGGARGRVLMLLDACHSGHVSTEIIAPNEALARQLSGGGRAGVLVFAASRGAQLSYEVPSSGKLAGGSRGLELAWDGKPAPMSAKPSGGGHGLFTGSLLEALAGSAPDRDHSGSVEVGELIDFVTERVRAASNGKQTPWVARREMFGDFVMAPASATH